MLHDVAHSWSSAVFAVTHVASYALAYAAGYALAHAAGYLAEQSSR